MNQNERRRFLIQFLIQYLIDEISYNRKVEIPESTEGHCLQSALQICNSYGRPDCSRKGHKAG